MAIDPELEQVLTLAEAAKLKWLPKRRAGKRLHVSTVYRWTEQGCRGIVLESIQVGATRCTSVEALKRFFTALNAAAGRPSAPSPSKAAEKRFREADRKLEAAGI